MTGEPSMDTRFVHAGSDPRQQHGYVNPPVHRASTVLYENVAAMDASQADPSNAECRSTAASAHPPAAASKRH